MLLHLARMLQYFTCWTDFQTRMTGFGPKNSFFCLTKQLLYKFSYLVTSCLTPKRFPACSKIPGDAAQYVQSSAQMQLEQVQVKNLALGCYDEKLYDLNTVTI